MVKFTKAHRLALSKAAKARYAKKGKKRGRKPGVKVGPYKKKGKNIGIGILSRQQAIDSGWNIKTKDDKLVASYSPAPMVLCGQLEDAILLLENRISNAIAKINSLM